MSCKAPASDAQGGRIHALASIGLQIKFISSSLSPAHGTLRSIEFLAQISANLNELGTRNMPVD